MLHVGAGTTAIMLEGVLAIDVQVSVVKNPLPVIVTPAPTGPEIGLSAIVGPVTVKVA